MRKRLKQYQHLQGGVGEKLTNTPKNKTGTEPREGKHIKGKEQFQSSREAPKEQRKQKTVGVGIGILASESGPSGGGL